MLSSPTLRPRSRRFFTKERWIVLLLLMIPLTATIAFTFPMPAEFTLRGKLVPMSEIGVDGSVYFTVVESGTTSNLAQRWQVYLYYSNDYEDIEFTSIPREDFKLYQEQLYETETLTYSVEQAVAVATGGEADSEVADVSSADTPLPSERVEALLEELDGYYGNSLGLMVAIGLYEEQHQLHFADRTGLQIAGTGTMEEGGWVGSVGAVEEKLLGAASEGTDLFFIPADYEWYGEEGNEAEALRVKEEHALTMEIVPVETYEEAIAYLLALQS